MAFHNTNYEMINLTTGTYGQNVLGNGITASTAHEVYCITSGSITITAIGGGTATFPMTAGQTVPVLAGTIVVSSGTYVAFRAKFAYSGIAPNQYGLNP